MTVTEAVEVCPWCGGENAFPDYDVERQGYVVRCQHCNHEIFLCDECFNAEDNPTRRCDWHEIHGKDGCLSIGICFRGCTINRESKGGK